MFMFETPKKGPKNQVNSQDRKGTLDTFVVLLNDL